MITNTTQVKVRWGDADPAGIAFYPRFYEWYDFGTEALFASIGLPFPETFERYRIVGVPIVESGSTFLSPARWADVLTIRSSIAWVKDKTFRVEHEIRTGDRLCARGFEVRAWVRRPETPGGPLHAESIPEEVRKRLTDMGGLAAGPPTPPTLGAPRETRGAPRNIPAGTEPGEGPRDPPC